VIFACEVANCCCMLSAIPVTLIGLFTKLSIFINFRIEIPLECPKYFHPISDWAVHDFRWSKNFLYLSNFCQLLNYKIFMLWSKIRISSQAEQFTPTSHNFFQLNKENVFASERSVCMLEFMLFVCSDCIIHTVVREHSTGTRHVCWIISHETQSMCSLSQWKQHRTDHFKDTCFESRTEY